jgi:hypothetical protein
MRVVNAPAEIGTEFAEVSGNALVVPEHGWRGA